MNTGDRSLVRPADKAPPFLFLFQIGAPPPLTGGGAVGLHGEQRERELGRGERSTKREREEIGKEEGSSGAVVVSGD
ncbi:hypothetical protein Hdeb2414_s0005g00157461 [Helianthus debilis subsp. tardiflorus]